VFGLIGLFRPGFQGIVTRRVSASEQGRLQGANSSLAGLPASCAPTMFGFTYAYFVAPGHPYLPVARSCWPPACTPSPPSSRLQ
jgi:DHA1 family tetracycline resistance protein-like MFS transporter